EEGAALGEEFIEDVASQRSIVGRTEILATFEARGRPPRPLAQARPVIKGTKLRFKVRTDVPEPYEVIWKVRNRGPEAERAKCLRGQLLRNQPEREEGSLYTGRHYIDCYLVREGVLLGSDRFIVTIL